MATLSTDHPVLNTPADLRPVGTEYQQTYEPSLISSAPRYTTFTYRVVEHILTAPYGAHGPSAWAERIDIVDSSETPAQAVYTPDGSVHFKPL